MISIIIPAHNEEKVIANTLSAFKEGLVNREIEVIVVCNGCTDNTANIVASFGKSIKCIETPVASKVNALNLGDTAASFFPRIYQDADVFLSLESVRQLTFFLQSGRFFAAGPLMQMEIQHASWMVRSYYEVWRQLPYVQEGMIGTGVYALSEEGRNRFDRFPDIIADDRFIRALFKTDERTVVMSACSVVRAPTGIMALVRIKTRSRLGGYEFEKKFPELLNNEKKKYGAAIWISLKKFKLRPTLFVYLLVNLGCRARAWWQLYRNMTDVWERDETSRND